MTILKRIWLTANTEHEGFPIYFRRPDVRVAEFEALRPKYPMLLVVTHVLACVKENGLPEHDYNDSLESLDVSLTAAFEDETVGLIALIETFAGKRTYYIYLATSFVVDGYIREVKNNFPREELTFEVDGDPFWRLFNGYAADFHFT
ncbi:DUF695 domain-containing protein [Undibacterium terreum]|uniref:DUF695 domain-containing protein n=1 Tax=Undibacterium terreum TaxID=1224302 RepID=A0A916U6G0_9BURK|nr:DUF695 domain-containing protein [Undibacterium terreum]GGC61570.1 hypothetical protein GCM10011396_05650 [Undibacterium terreum]